MENRPIKRLVVENHFNVASTRRILVAWEMNPAFDEPGPYTFTLQRGRAANEDSWEDIAQTVDQPWAYDNYPKLKAFDGSLFYRVVFTDGNKKVWTSQPVAITSDWDHYDWARMKEVIRKETLLATKAGTPGWLLKRRLFGEACPCVDPNTNTVRDANCPDCFGTGILGGYYPALEYPTVKQPDQRMKRLQGDAGLLTTIVSTVRALAWAVPEANDVWVNAKTNQRYFIAGDIQSVGSWRGVDLILNLRLTEIQSDHIVYSVPTP